MAEILDGTSIANVVKAGALIREGQLVAFPTETVYGLGANALDTKAVKKIFAAKGRPYSDPLIVHVGDHHQVESLVTFSPQTKELFVKLTSVFWPGPLTLVMAKSALVPLEITAGLSTVALRMPKHLVALELIKESQCPIAAPSANKFQSLSPTTAKAVDAELGRDISMILDGGPCEVGLESTVLSLVGDPQILRPGGIPAEEIAKVIGINVEKLTRNISHGDESTPMVSPGMLEFHYAPKKNLKLLEANELGSWVKSNRIVTSKLSLLCFDSKEKQKFEHLGFGGVYVLSPSGNLGEAAHNLFQCLRQLDEASTLGIVVIKAPQVGLGVAINDRLKKAQHGYEN